MKTYLERDALSGGSAQSAMLMSGWRQVLGAGLGSEILLQKAKAGILGEFLLPTPATVISRYQTNTC